MPDCCKCSKQTIKFNKKPKNTSWTATDAEKTIFEETICLGPCKQISIDSVICAELSGLTGEGEPTAYNTYKLYIDDVQVCQSGFEAESDQFAPNLATASLIWGGNFSCKNMVTVKVTAQITVQGTSTNIVTSNIHNSIGNFQGAKGAFLRVLNF